LDEKTLCFSESSIPAELRRLSVVIPPSSTHLIPTFGPPSSTHLIPTFRVSFYDPQKQVDLMAVKSLTTVSLFVQIKFPGLQ